MRIYKHITFSEGISCTLAEFKKDFAPHLKKLSELEVIEAYEAATDGNDDFEHLKAVDVIDLIEQVENIEELLKFETDDRKTVIKAIAKRKEELLDE